MTDILDRVAREDGGLIGDIRRLVDELTEVEKAIASTHIPHLEFSHYSVERANLEIKKAHRMRLEALILRRQKEYAGRNLI